MSNHSSDRLHPAAADTSPAPIWTRLVSMPPTAEELTRHLESSSDWTRSAEDDEQGEPYDTWRYLRLPDILAVLIKVSHVGATLDPYEEKVLLGEAAHAINAAALGLHPGFNSPMAVKRLTRLALLTGNGTNPPMDYLHGIAVGDDA
ncbi:hypothetical protein ACIHFD_31540 [Nonomuraea sp. NPDC051941]|uniref:hypothetical protein n=1 Tax=Nonomuraea sp. NPDC051941 TaxID=3364373 RepID=UPI0037C89B00